MSSEFGIYCLSNDVVLEWSMALFESIRTHNPSAPMLVIPYDENISRLSLLRKRYRFEFFADNTLLSQIDTIARAIGGQFNSSSAFRTYRKLAAFLGPFEQFFFFDADIVVLKPLDDLLDRFVHSGSQFCYFDRSGADQVYSLGLLRTEMTEEYGSHQFNSGAFISTNRLASLGAIQKVGKRAEAVRDGFSRWHGDEISEQPFLNYFIDTLRVPVVSVPSLDTSLSSSTWAAYRAFKHHNGTLISGVAGDPPKDSFARNGEATILHWAGFDVNYRMPNKVTFLKYRLKSIPHFAQKTHYLYRFFVVCGPPGGAIRKLKRFLRRLR